MSNFLRNLLTESLCESSMLIGVALPNGPTAPGTCNMHPTFSAVRYPAQKQLDSCWRLTGP